MPDEPVIDVESEEIEESKPSAGELVIADLRDPVEPFLVLDRHDEEQILEEMQRRALKVLLYDFDSRGTRMIDLSYAGVLECVRVINATGKVRIGIDRDSLDVVSAQEDLGDGPEEVWMATVFAREENTGYGAFGTAMQPKNMHLRNNKTKADPFARQKALSKAQRNALKAMIPEELRQVLIAQHKGDEVALRQIKAGPGAAEIAELPPPAQGEKADALRAQAREVYAAIRVVNPMKVLPASFHAYLTRSDHSEERLAEFVAYLEQRLEEAKRDA